MYKPYFVSTRYRVEDPAGVISVSRRFVDESTALVTYKVVEDVVAGRESVSAYHVRGGYLKAMIEDK